MNRSVSRQLEQRLRALEKRTWAELNPKRTLPDWLQADFEEAGWKFDAAGRVLFVPPSESSVRPEAPPEPDADAGPPAPRSSLPV